MADQHDRTDDTERQDHTVITDPEQASTWGERHGIVPARARGDESGPTDELVHRDDVTDDHETSSWSEFREEFDERNLAIVHTGDDDSPGTYRLVDRSQDLDESGRASDSLNSELLSGETVETEVTEREVVETEVVQEATIESDLVGSEVVEREVVDTEIIEEELVDVAVVESADAEVVDSESRTAIGDEGTTIAIEEQGGVVMEIDETRVETEQQLVEHVVESRIVDESIDETTTQEDASLDIDVDAASIHEHIGQSGLLEGTEGDGVIDQRHIETDFDEDDRATSTISEYKTVENVVRDRKVVTAGIDDVDVTDTEHLSEEVVDTGIVETGSEWADVREQYAGGTASAGSHGETDTVDSGTPKESPAADSGTTGGDTEMTTESETTGTVDDQSSKPADSADTQTTDTDEHASRTEVTETAGESSEAQTGTTGAGGDVEITRRLMGRSVELQSGEEVGMVSDVDADDNRIYVDEDPSLTDKIKAALGWGDDDRDASLTPSQIAEVNSDAVVVTERDEAR